MSTATTTFLDALVPPWRASLPPTVSTAYFDAFIARNREKLEQMLAPLVATLDAPAQSSAAPAIKVPDLDSPRDGRTKGERTAANLAAMQLVVRKAPGKFTAAELGVLLGYSGWGGLSIDSGRAKFPPGLVPEGFGLIHGYYAPTVLADALADAVCSLLPGLAGTGGVVRALEPSAGTGRLIRGFSARRCLALQGSGDGVSLHWTAVELSNVSSKLLAAVRPDVDLYNMPFERWVREESSRYLGTFNFVVSNPPYGERGAAASEDPDDFYKENRAYIYFMRRALDLLVAHGLGVFLVPAGFLTGNGNRAAREKLLLRHHLSAAYRLPSQTTAGRDFVPGANVVMDVLFWRSRGGELTQVDPDDQFIVDGEYFEKFPTHILGNVEGQSNGEEESGVARKGRWRYSIVGDFTGLPPLEERPLCQACVLGPILHREAAPFESVLVQDEPIPDDIDQPLKVALALGQRIGRFLAAHAADDVDKVAQLWPELHAALEDFKRAKPLASTGGNPWKWMDLRTLAERKKKTAAQQFLSAFQKSGALIPALAQMPKVEPRYQGPPDDVVAQAESLFRQRRALTLAELQTFHARVGGTLGRDDILAALFAAEWNLDGPAWNELYPHSAYTTGTELWARHDRAAARAARGDEQAAVQTRRLLDAIRPAVFEDIADINPQHGYVPLDLVSEWVSATLNQRLGPIQLERVDGLVQVKGRSYTQIDDDSRGLAAATLAFLGYLNHDPELFKPPRPRREKGEPLLSKEERAAMKRSIAEEREKIARAWCESFQAWLGADPDRRARFTEAYNRTFRGRIVPIYPPEPLDIARWGANAPKLRPHQVSGARRLLANRGGLLAFDVGVGKTYTALATLARARQEGWVRRPVILVPSSLVWKWHDDILCTLPDYRVVVIGSNRKRITRGDRKGVVTSETDTPEERAAKWVQLQSGQVDVVVLSFDALGRTKMNQQEVLQYIDKVEAVRRSIALRRRNLEDVKEEKLSERDRALLHHGVAAWVAETLKLPKGHAYDPGVAWDELGIDMLIVDEAAAF